VGRGERARREKARFLSEREEAVATLREVARLSVESALTMRRRGENAAMRAALPPLEEVYQRAAAKAPNLAEVEYLMGRMWRAMMVYDRALACQERALGKDPAFGPAMYERAILLSRRLRDLQFMVPARQQLAAAGNTSNSPVAESLRAESETIRATIVADCEGAERLLRKGNAWLKEANVLSMRGILAFFQGRTAESASLLREAIRRDPTLEEAWETMAEVVAVPVSEAERRDRLGPLARAEACTTEALSHDRGYTPHLHARSRLRCDRAQILAHRGEDPFPDLAAAEEDIARALDLNPDRWESWKQRAIVHTLRGEFRLRRGEVATADWSAAERALSEALRLFPTSTSCWRRLAEIRLHQADDRIRRGEDPAERLERSIEAFTQAAATPGDTAYHLFRCSEARLRLALHRANADADLAAAEADATRAVELWPQFAKAMSQRGHVRRERARRREGAGDAPGAARDYEEAAADYAEALRLTPSLRSDVGAGLEEAQAGARRLRRP
jgi:tetratricopeptide (TPR) repeat protein